RPATEDAARITGARQWGESRSALQKRELERAAGPALPIPEDLPSPELVGTTRQIHQLIESTGTAARFESYTEAVPAAGASLRMIAIPGGSFLMGSPEDEPHRKPDEGPQHEVSISPFWISEMEIPWELYTAFMENGRPRAKDGQLLEEQPDDELWDAVTQPTAPYTAMNLGMGHGYEHGMPAISMSHHAASKFCEWLSAQTGHYYRLPTEAEWEYAARAGNSGAYCYGSGEDRLDRYAWYWDNSNDRYQRTGTREPNAWGLRDMHGNVAEWVLDSYVPDAYGKRAGSSVKDPLVIRPGTPHIVRGGSWEDDPDRLRSAARRASTPAWNRQDPQNPKSIWYLTDGGMIGFRVVRPLHIPDVITMHRLWNFSKGEP
ncbi:formylglycine-generating enzyme family protein, partial [Akkermansia sp.]